jgi:hypothetical protein
MIEINLAQVDRVSVVQSARFRPAWKEEAFLAAEDRFLEGGNHEGHGIVNRALPRFALVLHMVETRWRPRSVSALGIGRID